MQKKVSTLIKKGCECVCVVFISCCPLSLFKFSKWKTKISTSRKNKCFLFFIFRVCSGWLDILQNPCVCMFSFGRLNFSIAFINTHTHIFSEEFGPHTPTKLTNTNLPTQKKNNELKDELFSFSHSHSFPVSVFFTPFYIVQWFW